MAYRTETIEAEAGNVRETIREGRRRHLSHHLLFPTLTAAILLASACSTGSESTSPDSSADQTQEALDSPDSTTMPSETTVVTQGATIATKDGDTQPSALTEIVVESTTAQYFVLYVRPDLNAEQEIPVAIVLGQAGTTTLSDGRTQLPQEHYRVATLSVDSPEDVDGDGIDDLTELAQADNATPLNPAPPLNIGVGAVTISDHATFETLSYQGDEVSRDAYLAGLEFVKFWIIDTDTANPSLYFMNTERFRAHPMFASEVGIPGGRGPAPGKMRGDIVYDSEGIAPDGSTGTYRYAFQPNDAYPFSDIALAYEMLITNMPALANSLSYEPYPSAALPLYEREKATYDAYRIPILLQP